MAVLKEKPNACNIRSMAVHKSTLIGLVILIFLTCADPLEKVFASGLYLRSQLDLPELIQVDFLLTSSPETTLIDDGTEDISEIPEEASNGESPYYLYPELHLIEHSTRPYGEKNGAEADAEEEKAEEIEGIEIETEEIEVEIDLADESEIDLIDQV